MVAGELRGADKPDVAAAKRRLADALAKAILEVERDQGRRVSRQAVARELKVSLASVYDYLSGKTTPNVDVFDNLLCAFGVTGPVVGLLSTLRDDIDLMRRRSRVSMAPPSNAPRQLPATTQRFVGRGTELDHLMDILDTGASTATTVLVTAVDGSPGVGKTTLAVRWAHQIADRYPDGQLYVDLQGFGARRPLAPSVVAHRFLQALGVPAAGIPDDLDSRAGLFRTLSSGRRLLVLLDNARSAEQVRPLLPATPTCLVVVTSRQRLDSLVVREGARRVTLDVMSPVDAVALLAGQLGADRVNREQAAAEELANLCAYLPLALSIAAAKAAGRPDESLDVIARELRELRARLDALDSGEPDSDLHVVFEWSYALLPPAAARLFRLLGTHPGADVDQYTCAALLGVSTPPRPLLELLIRASLVTEHRPGRFGCHDLLRAYAERLVTQDSRLDQELVTERALDYYLGAVTLANQRIQPNMTTEVPDMEPVWSAPPLIRYGDAMEWFNDELPAVRAMITLAASRGFEPYAWRLAWACTVFLRRSGRRIERADVHRLGLEAAERAGDRFAHATTLRLLADAVARLGRQDDSIDLLHTSLAEFDMLDYASGVRQAHLSLARVFESRKQYRDALDHARHALRLAPEDDPLAQADGWTAVAKQMRLLGDAAGALELSHRALALYSRINHAEGEADILMNIGAAEAHLGDYDEAVASYQHALDIDRELGDQFWAAHALDRLADVHEAAGNPYAAREHREAAVAAFESLYHPDAERVRAKLTSSS